MKHIFDKDIVKIIGAISLLFKNKTDFYIFPKNGV